MDKELANKWISALRSGEYKQGKCRLYRSANDSYCCLGVLAKLQDKPLLGSYSNLGDYPDSNGTTFCGIKSHTGLVDMCIGDTYYNSLASANDHNESFELIANWIEANYELL